ncbi:hypothetical protein MLD38_020079 [Melastoma candidum]|uniref:Uncharacterized protein n=1 Tax=Melastoma candidum TaxID=119954 RepID=A0ACB9QES3_9MYRT|nr:hypothetical protein MLD38_020079 [Melastoma candidum]
MAALLSFPIPKPSLIRASVAVTPKSAPALSSVSAEELNQRFGRKGITFRDDDGGGVASVEMTVRNGSSVKFRISDAHVTSYKPKVFWKEDGCEEVLYTIGAGGEGSTRLKGGIGLVLNEFSEKDGTRGLLDGSQWSVKDVDSDAIDALQVELSRSNGSLDIKYVITIYPYSLATAVMVTNNGRKAVKLTSAILSHLRSKSRGGTAVNGLRSCSYCSLPPLSSPFEILSPVEAMKIESPGWFSSEGEDKPGSWTVQEVPFTILENKISRVYATPPAERQKEFYNTPPSKYETLDQGRELFFRMIKLGFEDIYLSSPGSLSKNYGKEYFICTGPATMLVPAVVEPGEGWRGAQVIEHDNLS